MVSAISGKIIAVTGAASGIGRSVAQLLRESGASVAALDVNWPLPRPDDTSSQISRRLDVADEVAVEATFASIAGHFGRLDGLATCAGILDLHGFDTLDAATFRRIHEVNVIGTFACMKASIYFPRQPRSA